jgi:hypothetical protein
MKRSVLLLSGLGVVLVLALWWMLLWSPAQEELASVEASIEDVQAQQLVARSRITALEGVREQAPQLQAELAAGESVIPRDTSLPGAVRQLQQASEEAGLTMVSVAPARPEPVEGGPTGLYSMGLTSEVRGTYFQVIDMLRRLEDPAISPRGLDWNSTTITIDEEAGAPNLIVVLTGEMFALLPAPPADGVEDGEPPAAAPSEGDDAEADANADGGADAEDADGATDTSPDEAGEVQE